MSWSWIIIVVVAIALYFLWTRRGGSGGSGGSGIQRMDAATLQERLKSDPNSLEVIDVREPFEFQGGHIPKAKNIPLGKISERFQDLANGKDIVFICRSGNRSMAAARQAQKAGLKAVYNVPGGMSAWKGSVKK